MKRGHSIQTIDSVYKLRKFYKNQIKKAQCKNNFFLYNIHPKNKNINLFQKHF